MILDHISKRKMKKLDLGFNIYKKKKIRSYLEAKEKIKNACFS